MNTCRNVNRKLPNLTWKEGVAAAIQSVGDVVLPIHVVDANDRKFKTLIKYKGLLK